MHRAHHRLAALALPLLTMTACGASQSDPPPTASPAPTQEPAGTDPDPEPDPDTRAERIAALRPALRGEPLSDDEVLFIDDSLRASGTDYTERGLATYIEWELAADVTTSDDAFRLSVAGARVNGEWVVRIDKASGRATVEMTATLAEPPPVD